MTSPIIAETLHFAGGFYTVSEIETGNPNVPYFQNSVLLTSSGVLVQASILKIHSNSGVTMLRQYYHLSANWGKGRNAQ